jgi:hypothetical protein
MSTERASVFDSGPDIDISGFAPRATARPAPQPDQVKAVSESASFVSRDPSRPSPQIPPTKVGQAPVARSAETRKDAEQRITRDVQSEPILREPRRHRTGRNRQFNIKARADTIERFYAITDLHGWVLGETFERAIEALERTARN